MPIPPLSYATYLHVAAVLEHEAVRTLEYEPWNKRAHTHLAQAARLIREQARLTKATIAHQPNLT